MPVIITDMDMPASCALCVFGQRIDNDHTMCLRHPMEIPQPDTDGRPSHCPLNEQPEIVRCEDCKHQDPDRFDDGEGNYVCRKGHGWKPDNWFCADGERRAKGR